MIDYFRAAKAVRSEPVQPGQVDAKDLTVQKQQRAQGLVVRRRRDLAFCSQHSQKVLNLFGTHVARMLQTMPADEKTHPVHIKLLGAEAIVKIANPLPDLIEQADRLQRRGAGFHGSIYTCMKIQYICRKPNKQEGSGRFSWPS
jgi:hypothetical protein